MGNFAGTFQTLNTVPKKVKRLSIERWHRYEEDKGTLLSNYPEIQEINPVFNRDGQYYCRISKSYWFEISGKAYTRPNDGKQFLFELEHLSHRRLRSVELEAIKTLIMQRICPQELLETYKKEEHLVHLQNIRLRIS